ncbi:unnamed protein product [Phytomonas sp. EM1]|nr:unnamed protein product [Phytomonas sp. EM1]|eukprot:CCW61070.1 unnamed protein product [Phytomonas sp. isolate EM1]
MQIIVWFATFLPCVAYFVCFRCLHSNLANFAVCGALGFSIGAFVLWIYSVYLAARYLSERETRDAERVKNIISNSTNLEKVKPTTGNENAKVRHIMGSSNDLSILEEEEKYTNRGTRQHEGGTVKHRRASEDPQNTGIWFYHNGKKYVGPRTTTRLSPTIPAFLSLLFILGAALNVLTLVLAVLFEIRNESRLEFAERAK